MMQVFSKSEFVFPRLEGDRAFVDAKPGLINLKSQSPRLRGVEASLGQPRAIQRHEIVSPELYH